MLFMVWIKFAWIGLLRGLKWLLGMRRQLILLSSNCCWIYCRCLLFLAIVHTRCYRVFILSLSPYFWEDPLQFYITLAVTAFLLYRIEPFKDKMSTCMRITLARKGKLNTVTGLKKRDHSDNTPIITQVFTWIRSYKIHIVYHTIHHALPSVYRTVLIISKTISSDFIFTSWLFEKVFSHTYIFIPYSQFICK